MSVVTVLVHGMSTRWQVEISCSNKGQQSIRKTIFRMLTLHRPNRRVLRDRLAESSVGQSEQECRHGRQSRDPVGKERSRAV